PDREVPDRVSGYDWARVGEHLDAHGWAVLPKILSASEAQALASLYGDDSLFRSRIVMARHGFGRGEYKYFKYPLPETIAALRVSLYPHLAPVANRWNEAMGIEVRYPHALTDFLA